MNDNFILLGTDTDAGKTTVALLWLSSFGDAWEYWKPVESGESDSATVARLVPTANVHRPVQRLGAPVAPPVGGRGVGAPTMNCRSRCCMNSRCRAC
jgi:dethiobiotin synthetase/malonyl-CoA O-methyltransferase